MARDAKRKATVAEADSAALLNAMEAATSRLIEERRSARELSNRAIELASSASDFAGAAAHFLAAARLSPGSTGAAQWVVRPSSVLPSPMHRASSLFFVPHRPLAHLYAVFPSTARFDLET